VLTIKLKDAPQAILRSGRVGAAAKRALRKAGRTATRDMRAEATKIVRDEKQIKAGRVSRAITTRNPKVSDFPLAWAIAIDGKPVSLMGYPSRQTRRGVTTSVNRGGGRTLIEHAFIARMKSGHQGVFLRQGKARLPIKERFGSKPQHVLRKPGRAEQVQARGARVLGERFPPLFRVEMAKAK